MSDPHGTIRTMSVRDATVAAGYQVLARADFGDGIALYRARSSETGTEALVRIVTGHAGDREARAAAVDHPNVLRLESMRQAPGYRILVFESFRGRSLAREGDRGLLDARRALGVASAAARALAYAHARGVVHGSVTAANIALGARSEVKVVGFGAHDADATPDRDVIQLGWTMWRAIAGDAQPGTVRLEESLASVARILERCMRLRPEIGFYPDARSLVTALEAAGRRLGDARADITGRFAADELAGLLQMIQLAGKSGKLEVAPANPGAESGAIAFRDGKIVGARSGTDTGAEAALKVLSHPSGRFRMWFGPVVGGESGMPIAAALLEASRRRDESTR
jgi:hypothetical protein